MKISELKQSDIGRWVIFTNNMGGTERGKIKSWNDIYIFVVYKCDNNWSKFQDYTGCATSPEDLSYDPTYYIPGDSPVKEVMEAIKPNADYHRSICSHDHAPRTNE